jgi:hypothetical protein
MEHRSNNFLLGCPASGECTETKNVDSWEPTEAIISASKAYNIDAVDNETGDAEELGNSEDKAAVNSEDLFVVDAICDGNVAAMGLNDNYGGPRRPKNIAGRGPPTPIFFPSHPSEEIVLEWEMYPVPVELTLCGLEERYGVFFTELREMRKFISIGKTRNKTARSA